MDEKEKYWNGQVGNNQKQREKTNYGCGTEYCR